MIQLTLSQEQMVIYEKKKDYVRENLSVKLDDDDIARICHTCDFDEQKIDQKLANYATKSKYQGLEEYEWQTTQTRAEKEAIKRKKREAAEAKRIQKERQAAYEEKKAI